MAVVTKKIANLPASTSVASTDVFVKETSGGVTQKIAASDAFGFKLTPLCSWGSYALNDEINLSASLANYDFLIVRGGWDHGDGGIFSVIMPVGLLAIGANIIVTTYYSNNMKKVLNLVSWTKLKVVTSANDNSNVLIRQIFGGKFGN